MSHPNPTHDHENERVEDSEFAPKRRMAKKMRTKKMNAYSMRKASKQPSFRDRLEAHKAEGASFDNGTWKPKKKGQSFIQALEAHKRADAGEFR